MALLFLNNFFYFSGVIAFIFSIVFIDIYIRIKNIKKRQLIGLLLIPVIYWVAGRGQFLFLAFQFSYMKF